MPIETNGCGSNQTIGLSWGLTRSAITVHWLFNKCIDNQIFSNTYFLTTNLKGFNGKESDNEVNGSGNQYDYGFRIYNSRLGKFLSVDPLFKSFCWYTPYQFAGNKPIVAMDLDGLEEYIAHRKWLADGTLHKFVTVDMSKPLALKSSYTRGHYTETIYVSYNAPHKGYITFPPLMVFREKADKDHVGSESEVFNAALKTFNDEIGKIKDEEYKRIGTTEKFEDELSLNFDIEGEKFTVNGVRTTEVTYDDIDVKGVVQVGAVDIESPMVQQLINDFKKAGYDVEVTAEEKLSSPGAAIGDPRNPKGVSIKMYVNINVIKDVDHSFEATEIIYDSGTAEDITPKAKK